MKTCDASLKVFDAVKPRCIFKEWKEFQEEDQQMLFLI